VAIGSSTLVTVEYWHQVFTPKAVAPWASEVRRLVTKLIHGFRTRGWREFVADFAQ
jgi:hypothetical protein